MGEGRFGSWTSRLDVERASSEVLAYGEKDGVGSSIPVSRSSMQLFRHENLVNFGQVGDAVPSLTAVWVCSHRHRLCSQMQSNFEAQQHAKPKRRASSLRGSSEEGECLRPGRSGGQISTNSIWPSFLPPPPTITTYDLFSTLFFYTFTPQAMAADG